MTISQKEDLYYYLSQFFGQLSDGKQASSSDMFGQSIFHNVKYLGLMWILGISVIGMPIIFIMIFLKGIVVGFTVGFLVNQMGISGFSYPLSPFCRKMYCLFRLISLWARVRLRFL